ncbi:alpha-mannosidase [Kallotenue papyrolyticum]|uniref:alpha-mannosidase n=1 Tax=Kallotenue papyrolyticum TaxID=1325125 RepID=UPI0004785C6A|nr:glycoside hydrolase family 38 C-terminal domain-containing protein [Kallotenue papyrolyticum]
MHPPLNLYIISHTHWDREWYLTFQQFRFRLVELIDDLLELLRRDPEFRHFHLDGQTIVLEDYLAIRPQREAELAAHIRSGRILVGPWYVQPDEFLVSGEAIIRNLLIGLRIARRYGEPMAVGYLPDSFGHIAQLPQLLHGFGLESFVHGRGTFVSRTGGTEYWWQGLDGSRVLGIFLANWYDNARRFPEDPDAATRFVEQVVERLSAAGAGRERLLMNGVDHLVAQANLSAIRRALAQRYQGGRLMHAALPEAIAALRTTAGPHLRTLTGELRDESEGTLLTGVLSARVRLKQRNQAVEHLLETWVEPYECWAALLGKPYERDFLRYAWKLLLQNHAHDSICGCSIDQVHREMLPRFDQAEQVGEELLGRALGWIAARVDTRPGAPDAAASAPTPLLVHNPLPRRRNAVAIFTLDVAQRAAYATIELRDPAGRRVPTQVLRREQGLRKELSPIDTPRDVPVSRYTVAARLDDLPACGYRVYQAHVSERLPGAPAALATVGGLENEHLRVTVAPDGTLTITDKASGQRFERLHFFRDEGDIGDLYNYAKPLADTVVETLGGYAEVRVLAAGPLVAELEIVVRPRLPLAARADREGRSATTVEVPIRTRVRLEQGSRLVRCETTLDNSVADHRLRVVFPLGVPVAAALADTSFGLVERPVELPSFWPFPSRDRPHRSLVDVRAPGRGLALLSRGLYEHDLRPDGQLELTLLRCVGHMFIDFATLEPRDPVPEGQSPGVHSFSYALLPHAGDLPPEALVEAAAAFNAPLRVWQTDAHAGDLPPEHSFLQLEPAALQLSAVKWAEDRDTLIVRCYNTTAQPVAGRLRVAGAWRAAYRVNLDEQREARMPLSAGALDLHLAPWQILSVELDAQAESAPDEQPREEPHEYAT